MTKTLDASGRWAYASDSTEHTAVLTGPIFGSVTVGDGTTYKVNEDWIEVLPEHVGELSHLIGLHHEEHGHPLHDDATPFVHICDAACGSLARPAVELQKVYAAAVKRAGLDVKDDEHVRRLAHIESEHARLNTEA